MSTVISFNAFIDTGTIVQLNFGDKDSYKSTINITKTNANIALDKLANIENFDNMTDDEINDILYGEDIFDIMTND